MDDFAIGHLRQVIGYAHHCISNQVRRVADHGQHQIMVGGVHRIDLGPHRLHQVAQTGQGFGVHLRRGRQQPPAVVKKRGKTRPRARIFRARHGVAGDEVNIGRNMGLHRCDHRLLDRPHIRHRGPCRQMRANFGSNRGHGPHGHSQHDQISALHRFGGGGINVVAQANLKRHSASFSRFGMAHNLPRQPLGPHRMRHRRGYKPQADQRHFLINHRHFMPLNWPIAWATRRHAASSPIVMRKPCGSL